MQQLCTKLFQIHLDFYIQLQQKNKKQNLKRIKTNAQQQFAKMAGLGLNLKLVLYLQSQ
jgi:hypothetical protein